MAGNANSFLMGRKTPSAKFPTKGTQVSGTITEEPVMQEQRDLDGRVRTWDDGNPMMQMKVVLSTEEHDSGLEDDNGDRALYVKGKMKTAVADAVRAAGASGLAVGGTLTVEYIGDGEPSGKGRNAPKLYRATYQPPAAKEVPVSDGAPF